MVTESNTTQRSKYNRGGNNSREKPGISKKGSSPGSDSEKIGSTSLRRSTRRTTSTSSATETTPPEKGSTSSKRKSECLDKKDISPTVKRKLEVMEKKKLSSGPLRRSDRGKKQLSPASTDSDSNKLRKKKSIKELILEDRETGKAAEVVKRSNGSTFKGMFRQQRKRESAPNLEKEMEKPEKLSHDDISVPEVSVRASVEVDEGVCMDYNEKIEEERGVRECHGNKEKSVSKSSNANAHVLTKHDVEISSVTNVVEEAVVAPSPSSEFDKDNSVTPCSHCCKMQRLGYNSPAQEICSCNNAPMSDVRENDTAEDKSEMAPCEDSSNDAVIDGKLDDKLMPDSSRFVEYWVPVSPSNVQLELYCYTLLSSSTTLRSSSNKDIVGSALHDILISTKKCCDHPYLANMELQRILNKDRPLVEYLDVGIKASGKLQLLDTLLPAIKSLGKKVLILYQSVRSAGVITGDFLDDFLRQRFGVDSYERVDKGIAPSKKHAALRKFNAKDSERFVFLLEKLACSPTIKLSSVDAVVIFDSDWNVLSDNRALHKITIDSSREPIKIFRLYTSCTLEEKVLDLATKNVTLDTNLGHIIWKTSHMLLMYGASDLFSNLNTFHNNNPSKSGARLCSDTSIFEDVAKELLDLFDQNVEKSFKNSVITKVQVTKETYSRFSPLFGQLKVEPTDGKEPHLFWNELLKCENPNWRFLSGLSQRSRKRAQHFVDLPPDDVTKKQKKTVNNNADTVSPRNRRKEGGSGVVSPKSTPVLFPSNSFPPASEVPNADMEEGNLPGVHKSLHGNLKSSISELSETLKLPENVKTMGERFLEYIVDNHQIYSEQPSIQQAFKMTLIWVSASLVRHQIDKQKSLDMARKLLGFCCTEIEVNSVHLRLRELKEKFKEKNCKELEPTREFSDDHLKKILKKCKKRKTKLLQKHKEEKGKFDKIWEEKRANLEDGHRVNSAILRHIYQNNQALRLEHLKRADEIFSRKMDEIKSEKESRLEELKGKQLDEINEENQKEESWLKDINLSGPLERAITLSELVSPDERKFHDGQKNVGALSGEKIESGETIEIPTVPSKSLSDEAPCAKESDVGAPSKFAQSDKSLDASNFELELDEVDSERTDISLSEPDLVENFIDARSIINENTAIENEGCDLTVEIPRETDVTASKESVEGAKSLETSNLDGEYNKENLNGNDTKFSDSTPMEDNNNVSGNTKSDDSFSSEKTSNLDGKYNKENLKSNDTTFSDLTPVEDRNNISDNTKSDDSFSKGTPLVTSPAVQILETRAEDIALPQNIAPQDEFPRQSTSDGILLEDTTGNENSTNIPEQAQVDKFHQINDDTHANGSYNVPDMTEGVSALTPPGFEQSERQLSHLEQPPLLNRKQVENSSGKQSNIESGENQLPPLSIPIVDEILNEDNAPQSAPPGFQQTDHNQPPSINVEHSTMENGGNGVSPLPTQVVDEVLHHDGLGISPPSDAPVVRFAPHHEPRYPQQMNLRVQPQTLLSDPLQIELERLQRETEEVQRSFKEVKLQVKSEYEKEKEELRRRYETKLKVLEAEHLNKKNELDANHSKVFMNRILAEAFRTKCLEFKPSVNSGMYQVPSTNFLHQLLMLSRQTQRNSAVSSSPDLAPPTITQQTAAPSGTAVLRPSERNSAVSPSPNHVPPAVTQQTAGLSITAVSRPSQRNSAISPLPNPVPPTVTQQTAMTPITAVSRPSQRNLAISPSPNPVPPSVTQQTAASSVAAVARSSPTITPMAVTQHRPFNQLIGNFPIPGTMRSATPPHLRSSLPTSSPPSSLPANQGLPRQHPFSQIPVRLPRPLPPQQPLIQSQNVLPCLSDFGSNAGLYVSQGGGERVNEGRVDKGRPSIMSDVVYLSDDE